MSKQYIYKKNFNNNRINNCRNLHKIINIILTLTQSIKTIINQFFNNVFLIFNINQIFIRIINIKTIIKIVIISTIKIIIKTLIITFKINIINIIKQQIKIKIDFQISMLCYYQTNYKLQSILTQQLL